MCFVILFITYKNERENWLSKNRDVILNIAKDYYENDKDRLRKQARGKYTNLSEEEKEWKEKIFKKQIS